MAPEGEWKLESGANVTYQGVRFKVWAPRASSVSLKVIGGPAEIPMDLRPKGYYTTFLAYAGEGTRYYYVLNGDRPRPDPVSRFQPEGVHGPSEVVDPRHFLWEDTDWEGIPLEKMIFYEIHTGAFTSAGTFEAVLPFLDYLRHELGVTAVELMPVAQFPGDRNWGYDGTYLYAPQNSYGGPKGLKTLINACHRKGLAVVLDVVYNHLGPEGNYLNDYGAYFTDRYRTPWGQAFNFDGPESDDVRKFVVDNALYWVTEFHLDGLRIDAVHGIYDFSSNHILSEIQEAVQQQASHLGRRVVVIAESNLNDAQIINPPSRGGFGLDAQWNDDFHHSLHTLLTGEKQGYYQDFGAFQQLTKALREGFVYSGQFSPYRKRRHGNSSEHLPPTQFVVFSQNHDQIGNRPKGNRLSSLVPFEALKLAAGMVLLSPNLPLLFMGEEYGESAPFQYFVNHSDPELIEAVRKGRREEFSAFQWEGEIPDPADEMTFLRSKINLDLRNNEKHGTLFEFYRTLIRFRKEISALSCLERSGVRIEGFEKENVILMKRGTGGDRVVGVFNLSDQPAKIETSLEKGTWQRIFSSASEEWGGIGPLVPESIESSGSEVQIVLDTYAFALYRLVTETD